MGDDEHSAMGKPVIEELNREPYKIVPISCHQTSFFCRSKIKLLLVRCLAHTSLMSADCIDSVSSEYFGNLRAEVFIEVKFHKEGLVKG